MRLRDGVFGLIVPLKQIEYGVDGDFIVIYPKPYFIYLRGSIPSYSNITLKKPYITPI